METLFEKQIKIHKYMKNKIIMFVAGLFLLLAMTGCNTNPKVEEEINECDTLEEV